MTNDWQAIWNRRKASEDALTGDWQDVFLELKRLNGYDIVAGGVPLSSFLAQDVQTRELLHLTSGKSVFEVGCGAGANLYLMARAGIAVGGLDYAETLVAVARKVLPNAIELYCGGGADVVINEHQYDAVFSSGVFPYFPDEAYAERVLTLMLQKSTGAIGIMGLHDIEKKEDYLAYRRATIPDYDEKYANLSRLFYTRTFFEEFARAHDLRIEFPFMDMPGYWNTPFIFDCFMYRK
jgi:magnesium protoporphyrin O-methyltransferase